MWEYIITFEDSLSANSFKNSLNDIIKSNNGVITTLNQYNFTKVLIAVPIIERFKLHNTIREKIAENILLSYKKDYILSRLNFDINQNLNMQIFLKALVVFDSDTDKEIILERMKFDSNLVVNSFINFRLSFLKRKWEELVELANDNSMYLLNNDTFHELIKFLISNLEYRYHTINIFSKQDCYLLYDTSGKVINDFLVDKNVAYDDNHLLTSLVALNPEKIVIHCNSFVKDKLLNTLYEYFSNRVHICK